MEHSRNHAGHLAVRGGFGGIRARSRGAAESARHRDRSRRRRPDVHVGTDSQADARTLRRLWARSSPSAIDAAHANKVDEVHAALQRVPAEADAEFLAAAGRVAVAARDMGLANALFRSAAERDPASYRAVLGMASMFLLQRNFDNASHAFDAARSLYARQERAAFPVRGDRRSGDDQSTDDTFPFMKTTRSARLFAQAQRFCRAASTARSARSSRSARRRCSSGARQARSSRRRRQHVHRLRDVVGTADSRPRAARAREGARRGGASTAPASARRARSKSSSASASAR